MPRLRRSRRAASAPHTPQSPPTATDSARRTHPRQSRRVWCACWFERRGERKTDREDLAERDLGVGGASAPVEQQLQPLEDRHQPVVPHQHPDAQQREQRVAPLQNVHLPNPTCPPTQLQLRQTTLHALQPQLLSDTNTSNLALASPKKPAGRRRAG
eukprot:3429500-Rhodomonas_salina.2